MHIGFPFRVDHRGRTAGADGEEYVRGLIEQVLFTAPGERVNRPGFGSGLRQLLFQPASGELATATRALVQAALQQWLGAEIAVQAVDVVADDGTVRVTVQYRTRSAPAPVTAVITRAA